MKLIFSVMFELIFNEFPALLVENSPLLVIPFSNLFQLSLLATEMMPFGL